MLATDFMNMLCFTCSKYLESFILKVLNLWLFCHISKSLANNTLLTRRLFCGLISMEIPRYYIYFI